MPANIPTTQEQKVQNLAALEATLSQTSPLADKAFLRVLAAMEAMQFTSLYKFGVNETLQNLALTATGFGLDLIGIEYGVIRKAAEAAVLTISLPGTNGTFIPATVDFIGDANGVRYFPNSSATIAGGFAVFDVTAEETGVVGNLQVDDTLSIGTQIPGAESTADVTVIVNVGADRESDEAYRVRVLDEIRSEGGGGNSFDYRRWSQEVAGVVRAFPFAGQPTVTGTPPDRTVFIEADTGIDPDGIAPQALLDEVRDSITTDPLTGITRQPLGLTDSTLWVESIFRTSFFVEITGLLIDVAIEAEVKVEIEIALTNYFLSLASFVAGLDFEKNDVITQSSVSNVVHDVLSARGGSSEEVNFGIIFGTYPSDRITLDPGEQAKLGDIAVLTQAWKEETGPSFINVTTAFGSDSTDVQILVNDDDRVYFGNDAKFDGVRVVLAVLSSADIVGVFEYWDGSTWQPLAVTDGTTGFTGNGDITWDRPLDWAQTDVNSVTKFYMRIQRTEDTVVTPPTEDTIKYLSDDIGVVYV